MATVTVYDVYICGQRIGCSTDRDRSRLADIHHVRADQVRLEAVEYKPLILPDQRPADVA